MCHIHVENTGFMCYVYQIEKEVKHMGSNTKKVELRRKRKRTASGKKRKRTMSKMSTPAFAIHVEKNE
jgi:hypothetical protein